MRFQARLLLGVCGLALAAPAAAVAAPLADDEAGHAVVGEQPEPAPHHHKGLFGRRHCVECQRAYAKAHDGVDIPAPPSIEQVVVNGRVVGKQGGACEICQGGVVGSGPVMSGNGPAPGYAVVGGPGEMASTNAPGYAVVGDGIQALEPAPIGVFRTGQAQSGDPRMAGMGPRPGPGAGAYDPSVVPTNLPPAQVALASPGHDRPHIISHLLGLPIIGQGRRAREGQERQKHAAIAYDQPDRPVTELPASMVYGKK